MYLVLEGTVTVYRDQVGKPMQLLARIGPGELLGEMCLFDEDRRSAAARAATACRLLRLGREPLRRLLADQPRLALHIQSMQVGSLTNAVGCGVCLRRSRGRAEARCTAIR